ncbi:hypothetical protein [Nitrosomonas sp. Nm51]|uniref:hypothetical protein n=1 Tax=Nitrosomonas sp. Nm51 TaxID=133720 RepID=UPI0015A4F82E|nr:hypothetical protein [Nitrosomonas sp. Nm51]
MPLPIENYILTGNFSDAASRFRLDVSVEVTGGFHQKAQLARTISNQTLRNGQVA